VHEKPTKLVHASGVFKATKGNKKTEQGKRRCAVECEFTLFHERN
jgi:hypothetical protein